jgi:hypothetical protein
VQVNKNESEEQDRGEEHVYVENPGQTTALLCRFHR